MTSPVWRKSSRSGTEQNACVEVAHLETRVGVRDSKNPEGGHIAMGQAAFGDLLARVKSGDLDL
ncbi:DUF397 domain-containing protein [Actinomadura monticuli]|uniref:DUF397 domain-containing protein n=1 Tax=Actinomadura monticuli TaxID=3097367 RepID=A0ABV4QCM3_9ACTN